jgi:hypothetical protein
LRATFVGCKAILIIHVGEGAEDMVVEDMVVEVLVVEDMVAVVDKIGDDSQQLDS